MLFSPSKVDSDEGTFKPLSQHYSKLSFYHFLRSILQVPTTVSHADFWQRYFYKLHQLDEDETRKKLLMQRADDSRAQADMAWDEEGQTLVYLCAEDLNSRNT